MSEPTNGSAPTEQPRKILVVGSIAHHHSGLTARVVARLTSQGYQVEVVEAPAPEQVAEPQLCMALKNYASETPAWPELGKRNGWQREYHKSRWKHKRRR